MPTEKHPVPQHIMGVEFKLVGDLTVRQFFYLIGGGVLAFVFYRIPLPFYWKWPLVIISGGLGAALTFIPLGERSLDTWIASFFKAIFSPTQLIWMKRLSLPNFLTEEFVHSLRREAYSLAPRRERWRLKQYLEELGEPPLKTELDLVEERFLKSLDFGPPLVPTPPSSLVEAALPAEALPPSPEEVRAAPELAVEVEKEKEKEKERVSRRMPKIPRRLLRPKKVTTLASEVNWSSEEVITIPVAGEREKKYVTRLSFVRPGRKLHGLPTIGGEIVMPVRGEKVFESTPFEEKAADLEIPATIDKDQADQSPSAVESKVGGLEETIASGGVPIADEERRERISGQVEILSRRLEQPGKEAAREPSEAYRKQLERLKKEKEALEEKVQRTDDARRLTEDVVQENIEYRRELRQGAPPKPSTRVAPLPRKPRKVPKAAVAPRKVTTGSWFRADVSNLIGGLVRDPEGSVVPGAVAIVRDSGGDPVRALKTNRLGQFVVTTPLPNGVYTVEVGDDSWDFDIMEVELTGEALSPLDFTGKKK